MRTNAAFCSALHGTAASSSSACCVDRQRKRLVGRRQRPQRDLGTHAARYVRGGNTPCSAMLKFSVRYGCRLLCGWLPPAGASASGAIATRLPGVSR